MNSPNHICLQKASYTDENGLASFVNIATAVHKLSDISIVEFGHAWPQSCEPSHLSARSGLIALGRVNRVPMTTPPSLA